MELDQSRAKIAEHCETIAGLNQEVLKLEAVNSQLKKTLELYNVPKLQSFDNTRLFQHNKILHVLANQKVCEHLLAYMDPRDIFHLAATSKLSKSFITSHPSFMRLVTFNSKFERMNIHTTYLHEQINKMKHEIQALQNDIIIGVKRYLYYDYSALDLVENVVEESMNSIEKLKLDLNEKSQSEKEKKNMMSFLKNALSIKEDKPVKTFKFNRIKRMPVEIQTKVVEMLQNTPFEKFMLLDTGNQKIEIKNPKEYKNTQNTLFKEEINKHSAEYMLHLTNLMVSMGRLDSRGENYESARDLCMFLIKELSKCFSCLQVLVREYYSLSKIKDFLFAELSAYNIQYAIAEHIAIKMTQHSNSLEYQELKAVAST
jgi:hypothetical protein